MIEISGGDLFAILVVTVGISYIIFFIGYGVGHDAGKKEK